MTTRHNGLPRWIADPTANATPAPKRKPFLKYAADRRSKPCAADRHEDCEAGHCFCPCHQEEPK